MFKQRMKSIFNRIKQYIPEDTHIPVLYFFLICILGFILWFKPTLVFGCFMGSLVIDLHYENPFFRRLCKNTNVQKACLKKYADWLEKISAASLIGFSIAAFNYKESIPYWFYVFAVGMVLLPFLASISVTKYLAEEAEKNSSSPNPKAVLKYHPNQRKPSQHTNHYRGYRR